VNRPSGALSVDQMLAQARSRLQRLTPAQVTWWTSAQAGDALKRESFPAHY